MSSHSCGYLNSKLRGQSGDSGISTGSHESDDENKIVTERSHDAHEDGQPNRAADVSSIINEDPEDSSTENPDIMHKDRYPTRESHDSKSHETHLMLVRVLVKSMDGPEKAFDAMDTNGDNKVTFSGFSKAMAKLRRSARTSAIMDLSDAQFEALTDAAFRRLTRDESDKRQEFEWNDFSDFVAPEARRWRLWVFGWLFAGYLVYYLTRGSFTFVAPFIREELGWSLQQVGRITSLFPILYGCSKFASGVLVDLLGSRAVLGGGLAVSGICNVAIAGTTSFPAVSSLWAANGFFQGFGGPACAKLLTQWFPTRERGRWWAAWTASQNLGGTLIPVLAGGTAAAYGWKYGMLVPGLIGIAMGVAMMVSIRNSPASMNLPPADLPADEPQDGKSSEHHEEKRESGLQKPSTMDIVVKYVLFNKAIWALAFSYFFLYVVRQGMTSWGQFYIVEEKGVASAAKAANIVGGLEVGGFFGGLFSGFLSDQMHGYRMRVVVLYMMGLGLSLLGLMHAPSGNITYLTANLAAVGFFIYGPQMLIGLIGAEVSHPQAVGTSNGLLGWIAYIGAAMAGEPVAHVVKNFGWSTYIWTMCFSCAVPVLLLVPFWSVRKFNDLRLRTKSVPTKPKNA